MAVRMQVWDINEPAPAALRDPVGLITASNAVHTCIDLPSAHPSPPHVLYIAYAFEISARSM